jgi:tripartite-type tricarboxylate transporter receptor subunit TctC
MKIIAAVLALFAASVAGAQDFPNRPLKIIQGFAPGGNGDVIARLIANEISKGLGQPVLVEARPGAGGIIGADAVAKSPADGYTMFLMTGGHPVAGATYLKLPYDTVASFQGLSIASEFAFLVAGRADAPLATMRAVIDHARSKPEAVSFGSAGVGATQHLIGELLAVMSGSKLLHVPYKGDSAAVTGLLGGEVTFIVAPPTAILGQLRAGKMKAYATTAKTRWARMPDVPTVDESGIAGFDIRSWAGLVTVAGTPRPVVDRLNAEINKALSVPEVRARLEELGGEVRGTTPEQMRDRIASDLARWNKIMDEAKIPRQ